MHHQKIPTLPASVPDTLVRGSWPGRWGCCDARARDTSGILKRSVIARALNSNPCEIRGQDCFGRFVRYTTATQSKRWPLQRVLLHFPYTQLFSCQVEDAPGLLPRIVMAFFVQIPTLFVSSTLFT